MAAASLEDRDLRERLLNRDPVATAVLFERFAEPVARSVARRVARSYAPDLAHDMAIDAIIKLGEHPERYDPERGSLHSFLVMDAAGDARNAAKREDRRQRRQTPIEDVELLATQRNMRSAGPEELLFGDAEASLPAGISRPDAMSIIHQAFPDERDRKALQLMGAGERRTELFARVFGIEHLGVEEQRREVKRQKDRIMVKRKRLLERHARQSGARITEAGHAGE